MKIMRATVMLVCVLLVQSCKKSSPLDYSSDVNEYNTAVDTINITNQYNNPPQNLEYIPKKQRYEKHRNDYDPEDFICPECGDEKEEYEELCYYCNEKLKEEKKRKEEENDEDDEDE